MDTNFDITIGPPAGSVYLAMAAYAPLGTVTDQLTIDPKKQPLASLLEWASTSVAAGSANVDTAGELGQELFQVLFAGKLGGHLRAALQDAESKQAVLRVRLNIDDLSVLSLPWEFLHDGQRGRVFASDESSPLVRALSDYATFGPAQSLEAKLPLRMLMVVPAVGNLDVQAEIDLVTAALSRENLLDRRIELTVLGGPAEIVTVERLNDFLQEDQVGFDILHFSGHGDTEGGRGNIRFNNAQGGEQWIDSGTWARSLKRYTRSQTRPRPLRLAVLNACKGGISAPKAYGVRSLLGMAPALIQNGFAAVVAMQYAILDDAALTFARAFYRALTMDTTAGLVDAAVTSARGALAAEFPGHRSFATPVLFLHTADGKIFDLAQVEAPVTAPIVPPAWPELTSEEEALLRQRSFDKPSDVDREVASKQRLLAQARFNRDYLSQQIQEMGVAAMPYMHSQLGREEASLEKYQQELAELTALQDLVDKAEIPEEMTFGDFVAGRLSDEVLALIMAPIKGDFDEMAVVASMRLQSPLFARRVAQRLLQNSNASDAQLAGAIQHSVRSFVSKSRNGFIFAPGNKFRRIKLDA